MRLIRYIKKWENKGRSFYGYFERILKYRAWLNDNQSNKNQISNSFWWNWIQKCYIIITASLKT